MRKGKFALMLLPLLCCCIFFTAAPAFAALPVSPMTRECLECHRQVTPGIVADWEKSRHSRVIPRAALQKPELERRVSVGRFPQELADNVVGCAECHTLNPESHKDSFDHNGFKVHTVVSPPDCAACHREEAEQYDKNKMSRAYGNLMNNPLYHSLQEAINGTQSLVDGKLDLVPPDELTKADSCLYCHGTKVEVKGTQTRETEMGPMEFPVLEGWPSQGVGRINPDGSKGSCSACHARHRFSLEMARKPATCGECHKGPDVVAYKVYAASKHGNIYASLGGEWDYDAVPWTVGRDFTAPTCAVCHASLLVDDKGEVIAKRTHQMNDRLSHRLFGLVYAHPQPKLPDTSIIKNEAGLPLPTELTGEPVMEYLIDEKEQALRRESMQKVCRSCHSSQWVQNKFKLLDNTMESANRMTLAATQILLRAWETGVARGPAQGDSIFNEAIEKMWVEQWLFYANATRISSAMGGADYGVFANGRWYMSKNLQEMQDLLELKLNIMENRK